RKEKMQKERAREEKMLEEDAGDKEMHACALSLLSKRLQAALTWSDVALDEEVETWYPNGSLFAEFEHLESVSLSHIAGWVKPQGFCGMKNLKSLEIWYSNLYDEDIPWCLLTNSSKLEEFKLEGTDFGKSDQLDGKFCML
ncbi:hypothetical protein ACLOJK_038562, partial [Asimina triloba]